MYTRIQNYQISNAIGMSKNNFRKLFRFTETGQEKNFVIVFDVILMICKILRVIQI